MSQSSRTDKEASNPSVEDTDTIQDDSTRRRPLREKFDFTLAFISLSVVAFTGALDATILSIALPVSPLTLLRLIAISKTCHVDNSRRPTSHHT
jgi:hypothetical protein